MHVFLLVLMLNFQPVTMQVAMEFATMKGCEKLRDEIISKNPEYKPRLRCFEAILGDVI